MNHPASTLTALLMLFPVLSQAAEPARSTQIVRAMIEAINERDFEALDGLVAEDVVRHSAATAGVQVRNLEEFKAFLRQDLRAVPDARQEINFIFGTESMVGVHVTYSGTQTGPMGPFPASGRRIELPFIGLLRIEDGKIAEMWVEWDNLGPLVQLGHIQLPGTPQAAR